jgi:hypothetical protein
MMCQPAIRILLAIFWPKDYAAAFFVVVCYTLFSILIALEKFIGKFSLQYANLYYFLLFYLFTEKPLMTFNKPSWLDQSDRGNQTYTSIAYPHVKYM